MKSSKIAILFLTMGATCIACAGNNIIGKGDKIENDDIANVYGNNNTDSNYNEKINMSLLRVNVTGNKRE
ncbi:hypothetical protein [Superficieibacter sp.]|uniref:hypothetical protein n=1 Tax=Superficieibacter sp. TaxID=2303322 RepID=UPI0028B10867|nr:hypothetical protein [Superficieibacter sp.]